MNRLTTKGETSHNNGVCCTHFGGNECARHQGDCTDDCCYEEAVWEKLCRYEDLAEEGRLVELPCKIGDPVFCFRNHGGVKHIHRGEVSQMFFIYDEGQMKLQIAVRGVARGIWGQNIFPTMEAAQAALEGGA